MLLTRGTNNYTNDADGNTLTGGGRTSSWDSQNRMVQCVDGSNTSTYQYGSDGLRRRSTVNGLTTDFALDGDSVVREHRAGAPYATYLTGASGPMYKLQNTNGTIRWYLYDGLGSVLGEVDPSGNVTTYAKYDVYGGVRARTGTATSAHGFVGALGHTSEAETSLIYMRARYMDPVTGRFTSEDPARSGRNYYTYASADPTNAVDPSGMMLSPVEEWIVHWLESTGSKYLIKLIKKRAGDPTFFLGLRLQEMADALDGSGKVQEAIGRGQGAAGEELDGGLTVPVGATLEGDGGGNVIGGFTKRVLAASLRWLGKTLEITGDAWDGL